MTAIDSRLFKAYDVRATVDHLTPEAARLIGHAIGSATTDYYADYGIGHE